MSTIRIAKNPELHGRTKHIDVKYFFLKELTERQVFDNQYCPTSEQIADIFTKALRWSRSPTSVTSCVLRHLYHIMWLLTQLAHVS